MDKLLPSDSTSILTAKQRLLDAIAKHPTDDLTLIKCLTAIVERDAVCQFAKEHQGICSTGQRVKQQYNAGDYTENSLKMAFGMIAQSAINEFAEDNSLGTEWCTEALDNKEFVLAISRELRKHFLGGENGQTAAI